MNGIEPVSLNALAKILGRSKSGLHYLEKAGHIKRNSLGKFDIAEVQRAIAENVDQTMANRRKSDGAPGVRTLVRTSVRRPVRTDRAGDSNNGDKLMLDGKLVTIEQAEAERDRCLALLADLQRNYTKGSPR